MTPRRCVVEGRLHPSHENGPPGGPFGVKCELHTTIDHSPEVVNQRRSSFSLHALEFQILNSELRLCRAVFELSHTAKANLPSAPETLNLAIPGTVAPNRKLPPKIYKM